MAKDKKGISPPESLDKIRHSLAHLLAASVLKKFPGTKLGIGPVIENGFYYDFQFPKNKNISDSDLGGIEEEMRLLIKGNLDFAGGKITPLKAKQLFKDQSFKLELIKEFIKEKRPLTVYKTGAAFLDLCRGGHVKNTREIDPRAFKLTHLAGAYWRGNEKNPQLTRIYGVAFETKKELDNYLQALEMAKRCDHRLLGKELELFMIDEEIGKGLPLWLPRGNFILHQLEEYMYELERKHDYQYVLTPILAKEDLYKKSGHLAHYREDMYAPIEIENEKYYLRPMNCPHHHAIYKHRQRSYRELPLRIAEFGFVHRYERSGVLSGLMRTRGFTINDTHIYTDEKSLKKEIVDVLKLTEEVYATFGIKNYWYRLSLPDFKNKEKYGDIKNKKIWTKGSNDLKEALKEIGQKFVEAPGEASFYGPKIDIQIKNIWGHEDTLSTIQVDYYSAPRFNLYYIDKNGKEQRAIVIHRAIMGSFERFFAFLLEKTCGELPLWLAPVQATVLPVSKKFMDYGRKIKEKLAREKIRSELGNADETLSKRIRQAELQKIPYLLVVGEREEKKSSVNVRHYRRGQEGEMEISNLMTRIKKEIEQKTL